MKKVVRPKLTLTPAQAVALVATLELCNRAGTHGLGPRPA